MLAQRLPSILPPLSPAGAARGLDDPVGGGPSGGRRPLEPAPVPGAAPFRLHGGPRRRRPQCPAGRGVARPSRRAVPRRVAGVPAAGARFAAAAPGGRRDPDRPRQPPGHLSGPLPARRRHESLPLRAGDRARLCLPPPAERALHRAVPGAPVGAASRPHRPRHRRAGRHRRRPDPAAAGRGLGRGRGAGRPGPRAAGEALCGPGARRHRHQRRLPAGAAGGGGAARCRTACR